MDVIEGVLINLLTSLIVTAIKFAKKKIDEHSHK